MGRLQEIDMLRDSTSLGRINRWLELHDGTIARLHDCTTARLLRQGSLKRAIDFINFRYTLRG